MKTCLSLDGSVQRAITFAKGIVDVYDWTTQDYIGYPTAGPSLFIDSDIINEGRVNNTIAHECYHWWRHRNYFNFKRTHQNSVEFGIRSLGTDSLPLLVHMTVGQKDTTTFGPALFSRTEEQTRYFDFGHAVYHDEEPDKDIEFVGLELTPFSAVWKVNYEGADSFHTSEADQKAYEPWSILEDKVCIETKLVFSEGSTFSTGGALTSPYENGTVNLFCGWGSAINIDDVQRIVLGDLVLWEAK